MRKRNGQRGFTIVELVMAVAVGLILLSAIWAAVVSGQRSSTGIERKVTTTQDARAALEVMAMEIRMASYNPALGEATPWVNPATCGAGIAAYRGIQSASSTNISIQMDLANGNPAAPTCGDAPNEIIEYAYDNANQRITRELRSCNAGTPVSGGVEPLLGKILGNPAVRTVNVVNGTGLGSVPVFRYFDKDGNELALDGNPADIPFIRRV